MTQEWFRLTIIKFNLFDNAELKKLYLIMREQLHRERQWIYPVTDKMHLLFTMDPNIAENIQHQLSDVAASIDANQFLVDSFRERCIFLIDIGNVNLQSRLEINDEYLRNGNMLGEALATLSNIFSLVSDVFSLKFMRIQKRYGYTNNYLLQKMKIFYTQIFRNTFKVRAQLRVVSDVWYHFQTFLQQPIGQQALVDVFESTGVFLLNICRSAYVFVEHPPQVLLVNRRFDLKVQFLIGNIDEILSIHGVNLRFING